MSTERHPEPLTDAEIEEAEKLCKAYREREVLSIERALTFADVADQHWPRALAEVKRLRERIGKYKAALESLVPMGSEFMDNPEACRAFAAQRLASAGQLAKERNEMRNLLLCKKEKGQT